MIELNNKLCEYLKDNYKDIFDEQQMDRHIQDYIGLELANQQVELVLQVIGNGDKILDVGSGFGSFVLAARLKKIDAVGVELADFEVEFARERLLETIPSESPEDVFRIGNGLDLEFESGRFNVVTLWNVLEHVSDYKQLLSECVRVLRPGGVLYIICPNYAAFREEAHYHVFWPPLIPRKLAVAYLRFMGKAPRFFETNIFYRTNWGVLWALRELNMVSHDVRLDQLLQPELINNPSIRNYICFMKTLHLLGAVKGLLKLSFVNPFKNSVFLYARKRSM